MVRAGGSRRGSTGGSGGTVTRGDGGGAAGVERLTADVARGFAAAGALLTGISVSQIGQFTVLADGGGAKE